jgi:hypothetical protein
MTTGDRERVQAAVRSRLRSGVPVSAGLLARELGVRRAEVEAEMAAQSSPSPEAEGAGRRRGGGRSRGAAGVTLDGAVPATLGGGDGPVERRSAEELGHAEGLRVAVHDPDGDGFPSLGGAAERARSAALGRGVGAARVENLEGLACAQAVVLDAHEAEIHYLLGQVRALQDEHRRLLLRLADSEARSIRAEARAAAAVAAELRAHQSAGALAEQVRSGLRKLGLTLEAADRRRTDKNTYTEPK